jgi:hypothetical protein
VLLARFKHKKRIPSCFSLNTISACKKPSPGKNDNVKRRTWDIMRANPLLRLQGKRIALPFLSTYKGSAWGPLGSNCQFSTRLMDFMKFPLWMLVGFHTINGFTGFAGNLFELAYRLPNQ